MVISVGGGGSSRAAETVAWNKKEIFRDVPAGEAVLVHVSFVPKTDLRNVELSVEWDDYALVKPSQFPVLHSGEGVTVTLYLRAPEHAQSKELTGSLALHSDAGPARTAMPITVLVAPPKLEGIDADRNGVWDYMDLFIQQNFEKPDEVAVSQQITKALQTALLNHENSPDFALTAMGRIDEGIDCLYALRPEDASHIVKQIEAHFVNTSVRGRAYFDFTDKLSGQVISVRSLADTGSRCR